MPIHYTQGHDAWGSFIDRIDRSNQGVKKFGSWRVRKHRMIFFVDSRKSESKINVLQMSNSSTQSAQILMILRVPVWYLGTHKLETILSLRIIHSQVDEFETSIAKPCIFLLLPLHFKVFVCWIYPCNPPSHLHPDASSPGAASKNPSWRAFPKQKRPDDDYAAWEGRFRPTVTDPARPGVSDISNPCVWQRNGKWIFWKMDLSYWIIIHNSWPGAYISTGKKKHVQTGKKIWK